jgi:hypothetical protein
LLSDFCAAISLVSDNRQWIVQTIFQQSRNNLAVMNLATSDNRDGRRNSDQLLRWIAL